MAAALHNLLALQDRYRIAPRRCRTLVTLAS